MSRAPLTQRHFAVVMGVSLIHSLSLSLCLSLALLFSVCHAPHSSLFPSSRFSAMSGRSSLLGFPTTEVMKVVCRAISPSVCLITAFDRNSHLRRSVCDQLRVLLAREREREREKTTPA